MVFGSESSANKGMDGSEIEVREVKNGNVVYMAKDAFLFTGARRGCCTSTVSAIIREPKGIRHSV